MSRSVHPPVVHFLTPTVGSPTFERPQGIGGIACGAKSAKFSKDPSAVTCAKCKAERSWWNAKGAQP